MFEAHQVKNHGPFDQPSSVSIDFILSGHAPGVMYCTDFS